MALNVFDLVVGGQKGNKIAEGTITTVNDNYTITTGLSEVRGMSLTPLGMIYGARISPVSTTAGAVVISLVNSVGASLTVVYTVCGMFTGY